MMSCGSDSSNVSVGNANPLGTVGGVVIDAATEMPIMGAMITLVTGAQSFTATTDANGLFSATKVPSGAFILTIANSGYQSAMINNVLGGAVGNFPVKNPTATIGPVGLIKNDGTFSVKLVDEDGGPVAAVTVTARPQVRWVNYNNGTPQAMGNYEVTAMSGTDGTVTLTGLPDYTSLGSLGGVFANIDDLPIDVPPTLVMGSMNAYSFLGITVTFQVNHLTNGTSGSGNTIDQTTIKLAGPLTNLQVLSSSIDSLRGLFAQNGAAAPAFTSIAAIPYVNPAGPFTLEFNQSINHSTVRAQLFNEDGTNSAVMLAATGTSNQLSIAPTPVLTAGMRYNLALHVDAQDASGQTNGGTREFNTTVPLFIAPASGTVVKVNTTPVAPKSTLATTADATFTVDFSFNVPVGPGFGRGDAISCMAYYELGAMGLDNGAASLAPGEWPVGSTTGAGVTCPNPGLDITAAQPLESQAPNMPITGFSSRWRITIDRAGHPECISAVGCTFPSPPAAVHLLFSHVAGGNTIKFPDGTPALDNTMGGLSFPIPGP